MLDIIIEDGLSLKQERGIGQYTNIVYNILSKNYCVNMKHKYFLENIKNSTIRRILYFLWLNSFFLFYLLFQKKSTVCFFSATMTPIIKLPNIKYISVVHDIRSKIHPELSTNIQNIHANFVNWTAINFSDVLVTDTNCVKEEIIKHYKVDRHKIQIINITPSITNVKYDTSEKILKLYNLVSKNYLFFIGGLDKNKNVQLIIDAFNRINKSFPNLKLVIAGNKGNDKLISQNPNIIFTGFISNEDVKVLYKNALAYLFPSIYEGFGIPIIDAQTLGIPVICSDILVFREVAGEGALFSKLDIENFTKELKKILEDKELRDSLIVKGYENQKRFSIENIKEQIRECLS